MNPRKLAFKFLIAEIIMGALIYIIYNLVKIPADKQSTET